MRKELEDWERDTAFEPNPQLVLDTPDTAYYLYVENGTLRLQIITDTGMTLDTAIPFLQAITELGEDE